MIIPSRPKSPRRIPQLLVQTQAGAAKTSTKYVIKMASPVCCVHDRRQLNTSAAFWDCDTGAKSISMPVIRAIMAPVRILPLCFAFTRIVARIGPGIPHSETYRSAIQETHETVVDVTAETSLLERYTRR